MIRTTIATALLSAALAGTAVIGAGRPPLSEANRVPVVVELFTSEGCSSCPPADALLQHLDAQLYPAAEVIVLSEHVDYWNHIGWTDPYSSPSYSERQSAYRNRLHFDSVYTPQMIVDGTHEFVGSNSQDAQKAISKAAAIPKLSVRIADPMLEGDTLHAQVETGTLPAGAASADVILIAALNHAESQVAAGENSGHRLTHVAVVRALKNAGSIASGQAYSQEVAVKLEKPAPTKDLRIIALVQEPGPGKILGAAQQKLTK